MINKNLILRGTLPFLNKKLLKHTFYDICDLEDENKERMKKADITVTKDEVNEYFNNLLERYPMVKEDMTEEAISYMLISEGAKLKKDNSLADREWILLHECKIMSYEYLANYILQEMLQAKYMYDVYYDGFRILYDFTKHYKLTDEDAIKYGETLNPEVRDKTAMFIKDITSVLANKNAVILKRIIGFSKPTKEDK
jgi:hypothetical protein